MSQTQSPRPFRYALPVFCAVLLLSACAPNLTAVRDWSKTSLEASQYNGIVATYADTPDRLKKYDPQGAYDKQSAERKKQAAALKEILSVISDYMAALATLSADATFDYTKNADSITAGIKKLDTRIDDDTVGAVGSVVKLVGDAAAKRYQAAQVAHLVEQANEPLQKILKGQLRTIVDSYFRTDLKVEGTWIDSFYSDLQQEGKPSRAAVVAVAEWREERLAQNAKRVEALNAYCKVLENIAAGHQKLYDERNTLDSATLIRDLLALSFDLRKQILILSKS